MHFVLFICNNRKPAHCTLVLISKRYDMDIKKFFGNIGPGVITGAAAQLIILINYIIFTFVFAELIKQHINH